MIYFIIILISLFDFVLFGLSFSDIAIVIWVSYLLLKGVKSIKDKSNIFFLLFFLIGLISIFDIYDESYFKYQSYLTNIIKVFIIYIALLKTSSYLIENKLLKKYVDFSFKLAFFISILAITEAIFKTFGINLSFKIPFMMKSYNANYVDMFRTSVFYSEPAHLCFFLSINLIQYVFFYSKFKKYKINRLLFITVVVGAITTFSFGNFPLIIIALFLYYSIENDKFLFNISRYVASSIALIFIINLLFPQVVEQNIVKRFEKISVGQDNSTKHRLLGMYELSEHIYKNRSYFGVGLGQKLNYLLENNFKFNNYYFTGLYSGINNTLVEVLFGTGFLGLFFFLLYFIQHLKSYPLILITTVLMFFNGSHFNNFYFWMFISIIFCYKYQYHVKR